jgi:hypothetical protein
MWPVLGVCVCVCVCVCVRRQYEMNLFRGEPFMMLISDMCLWWDPGN